MPVDFLAPVINVNSYDAIVDTDLLEHAITMRSYFYTALAMLLLFSMLTVSADDFEATANSGEKTFLRYCAGCHGFEGKARYEHAPSFSLGDRLQKDDRELLQSVLKGKNSMPPWKDKLPVHDLRNAITFLRLMHERYGQGETPLSNGLPKFYYLFKPVGEEDMDWVNKKDNR